MERGTYFFDENGNQIASDIGIVPLPLFKGMVVTIHGYDGEVFEVVDWNYHHGHDDEDGGLRINLRRKT